MVSEKSQSGHSKDRRDVWNSALVRGAKFDGIWEMPILPRCDVVPTELTRFTDAKLCRANSSFIATYEHDYKFMRLWTQPRRYLRLFQAYGGAVSPDFSIYREMPLILQADSVYRSRALGFWWSQNGITVLPNVSWGDPRTFEFCFDGLPKHSVLAVSTLGSARDRIDRRFFADGLVVMLERLEPKVLVVHGAYNAQLFPPLFMTDVEVMVIKDHTSRMHRKRAS